MQSAPSRRLRAGTIGRTALGAALWCALLAGCKGSGPPRSSPALYAPPAAFLACAEDADCVQVSNDCAHCCRDTAINGAFRADFDREFAKHCTSFRGGSCECCAPDSEARCVAGACALREVPGSAATKCGR